MTSDDAEDLVTVEHLRAVVSGREKSPLVGYSAWWATTACARLNHPTRHADDPPGTPCICGTRRS